jgi:restriction system protein
VTIPDYQQFMLPLLKLTGDGEVHRIAAIQDSIVQQFGLTEEELQAMLPSGQQSVRR